MTKHGDPAFWTEKNMDIVEKFLKVYMDYGGTDYIIYFIPFQIFNAMYPVFISIGAGFGIPTVTNAIVILLAVIFGII